MKFASKLICAAGLALLASTAAQADVVINDWYFNQNGTGAAGATKVHENLDFVGQALIVLTPTSLTSFSFTEYALFGVVGHDGQPNSLPGPAWISSTFVASGSGNFSGAFTFAAGALNVFSSLTDSSSSAYSTGATNIGSFSVLPGGGGLVDGTGDPIANGQVTVHVAADTLASGYWLDQAKNDLLSSDVLAFAFTNANPIQDADPDLTVSPLCTLAGLGTDCSTAPDGSRLLFIGDNGQFKLSRIPEPASLALVGIALIAAGATSRKRVAKR